MYGPNKNICSGWRWWQARDTGARRAHPVSRAHSSATEDFPLFMVNAAHFDYSCCRRRMKPIRGKLLATLYNCKQDLVDKVNDRELLFAPMTFLISQLWESCGFDVFSSSFSLLQGSSTQERWKRFAKSFAVWPTQMPKESVEQVSQNLWLAWLRISGKYVVDSK